MDSFSTVLVNAVNKNVRYVHGKETPKLMRTSSSEQYTVSFVRQLSPEIWFKVKVYCIKVIRDLRKLKERRGSS